MGYLLTIVASTMSRAVMPELALQLGLVRLVSSIRMRAYTITIIKGEINKFTSSSKNNNRSTSSTSNRNSNRNSNSNSNSNGNSNSNSTSTNTYHHHAPSCNNINHN